MKSPVFRLLPYIKKLYYLFIPALILAFTVAFLNVVPVGIIEQLTGLLEQNIENNSSTKKMNDEQNIHETENLNIVEKVKNKINIRGFINKFIDVSDNKDYFIVIIIIGVIVGLMKFITFYFSAFLVDYMGRKMVFSLKNDLFENILYLPLEYFEKQRLGKILSIINSDIMIVQNITGQILMTFIKETFSIIFIVAYMLMLNPVLTLSLVIIAPIAVFMTNALGKMIRKIEKSLREKYSDITNIIFETLNNILIVKSFAMEDKEQKHFIKENKTFLHTEKKFISVRTLNAPFLELIGYLAVLGVLAIGGYQILNGGLELSELITFAASLALISGPIQNVSKGIIFVKQASASAERIFSIIDEEKENKNDGEKKDLPILQGFIRIENLYFSYYKNDDLNQDKPAEPILKGINFEAEQKTTIAIVGLSGAGKTTLIKLIPRLINPDSGHIYIDGLDTQQYNIKSLRNQLSLVTQEILLFHGSVADNIRYGKLDATMNEIEEASRIANAYSFIMNLPNGFDTQIGEKGVKLSGGQKQRIALARALIRKPKILILDEATSSLDTESEREIQKAFMNINHKQTTVVIAHRLSTIINSDKIYVIDKGKITECGTHKELLNKDGIYKRLYELQFQSIN